MKKLAYIAALIFLATCTQEEITSREYPRVRTLEVANITASGALFRGTVFYAPSPMTDHGFIWAELPNLDLKNAELVSLGPKTGTGDFQAKIERSMEAGKKYYARAYAKTDKYEVYGDILSFVSLGSDAPKITQLKPSSGHTLDTIRILGSNFSRISKYVKVKFDTLTSKILVATDTALSVIVPEALATPSSQVSVSVLGNIGISPVPFQLLGPTITNVTPMTVSPCDTLRISGSNFSSNISNMAVSLGGQPCAILSLSSGLIKAVVPTFSPPSPGVALQVTSSNITTTYGSTLTYQAPLIQTMSPQTNVTYLDTLFLTGVNLPLCTSLTVKIGPQTVTPALRTNTQIKVVIPASLATTSNTVRVSFGADHYVYQNILQLSSPVITAISPTSATFGDDLTITGNYFHPTYGTNQVLVGNAVATILSGSKTQLVARIQTGSSVCSEYDACNQVTVVVGDQNVTSTLLSLKKPIITSISPLPLGEPTSIVITGQNFSPAAANYLVIDNYRLPASFNSSTSIIVDMTVESLTNNPLYTSSQMKSLWVAVGNADPSRSTSLFSNETQVQVDYVGPWTELNPFTGDYRGSPNSFTIGGKGYLMGGFSDQNFASNQVWEYTPASDSWRRLGDFPGAARYKGVSFAHNGLGYFALGQGDAGYLKDVWEFNPTNETWTRLADFPGIERSQAFSFDFGGLSYVGGGNSTSSQPVDFWAFDPVTKSWIQKQDLPKPFGMGLSFATNVSGFVIDVPEVWRYDIPTDSWTQKASLNMPQMNVYQTVGISDYGYLFNGSDNFYQYDQYQDMWIVRSSVSSPRYNTTGFAIGNLYYYGLGYKTVGGFPGPTVVRLTDFYRLDMNHYPNP